MADAKARAAVERALDGDDARAAKDALSGAVLEHDHMETLYTRAIAPSACRPRFVRFLIFQNMKLNEVHLERATLAGCGQVVQALTDVVSPLAISEAFTQAIEKVAIEEPQAEEAAVLDALSVFATAVRHRCEQRTCAKPGCRAEEEARARLATPKPGAILRWRACALEAEAARTDEELGAADPAAADAVKTRLEATRAALDAMRAQYETQTGAPLEPCR